MVIKFGGEEFGLQHVVKRIPPNVIIFGKKMLFHFLWSSPFLSSKTNKGDFPIIPFPSFLFSPFPSLSFLNSYPNKLMRWGQTSTDANHAILELILSICFCTLFSQLKPPPFGNEIIHSISDKYIDNDNNLGNIKI